jgi:Transposase IS116/IS110/IS902 family
LHLVKHKSMLKHRIHSTLMTFGHPCPVTDLFGLEGRKLLDRLELLDPWRETVDASLYLIDYLESEIAALERQLRASGADHPYVPLLLTVPGIDWVLAFTIAAEIGDITRFHRPASWLATPAYAQESASPASQTVAGPCPNRDEISALGDARSDHARPAPPRLPGALSAQQAAPGQAARRPRRAGRPREKANRGDLAHAQHQPALSILPLREAPLVV